MSKVIRRQFAHGHTVVIAWKEDGVLVAVKIGKGPVEYDPDTISDCFLDSLCRTFSNVDARNDFSELVQFINEASEEELALAE